VRGERRMFVPARDRAGPQPRRRARPFRPHLG
jgi:hypothetical protein